MSRAEKFHFQKEENLRQAVWPGILAPGQKSGKIWNILIPSYLREKIFNLKTSHKVPVDPLCPVIQTGQEEKSDKYT